MIRAGSTADRSRSLLSALHSRRTLYVSLLSFASGLPLGLVWIAIPDWMRSIGVDIRVVGLFTLAQIPWSLKFLWSPLLDRFDIPLFGHRRGWIAVAQVALSILIFAMAGIGSHPETPWVVGALAMAIAFASATQDIAIDAYTVETLRPEERGGAVGARIALYRAAMYVAGSLSISFAGKFSWPVTNVALALAMLPFLIITWRAPNAEVRPDSPRSFRDAVVGPFQELFSRPRALEILLFVFLYKVADNLATTLLRPFLIDVGYSEMQRGAELGGVALAMTIAGTFAGGAATTLMGVGHALWGFGILQLVSNVGYIVVANRGVDVPVMLTAVGFDNFCSGLGTGAYNVLLLALTKRRFSATQYALLTSLFGLQRAVIGPIAGFLVHSTGWSNFFWLTLLSGLPGLFFLHRFSPLGMRDPPVEADAEK